ncbi:hypothetical protein K7432_007622 [Basidiobolus ranarum]|uniref:MyTH4 domain-containing protein n=1 Tax=Basidiobolus ranarum TaxID=34480 RepID=A0ABR2VZT6_9FUNG
MNRLFESSCGNFLTSKNGRGLSSDISRFSPGEWVEIKDPQSTEIYYANPLTGECANKIPLNAKIHPSDPNGEWWELYDEQNDLNYYYNTLTSQTEWIRPDTGLIVPLATIQNTAMGRRVSMVLANRGSLILATNGIKPPESEGEKKPGSSAFLLGNNNNQNNSNIDELTEATPPLLRASQSAAPESSNLKRQDSRWSVSAGITETSDKDIQSFSETSSKILECPMIPLESREEIPQGPSSSAISNFTPQINNNDAPLPPAGKERASASSVKNDNYIPPTLPPQLLEEMNQFQIDGFSPKYFAVHKKGIFRRKVSMEKLLQWSKDSLKQPLLILSKPVQKDALKCFKIIQKIMGDRAYILGSSLNKDTQWLLDRGIVEGELRDEIYVQLCKQLTHNPSSQSLFNGWQLMCVLAVTFPPSRNFEKYMQNFVKAHFDIQQSKINILSKHAHNKLLRISKSGPRGKVLTNEEIEQAKVSILRNPIYLV